LVKRLSGGDGGRAQGDRGEAHRLSPRAKRGRRQRRRLLPLWEATAFRRFSAFCLIVEASDALAFESVVDGEDLIRRQRL
jgi:hypothetical protein